MDERRLDRNLVVDEHIARDDVLQLRNRTEVADAELDRRLVVLALQEQDLTQALLRMRARIDERRVARERAGENAEERDAARERVGDGLEDERRLLRVPELDRRSLLRRRGDALDEEIEERGRAQVLRRHAARHRIKLVPGHRILERMRHVLRRKLFAVEVPRHQVLVGFDDSVEKLFPMLGDEL